MMVDEGSRQHLFSCLYRFKPMFGLVIWNAVNLMTNPGPGPVSTPCRDTGRKSMPSWHGFCAKLGDGGVTPTWTAVVGGSPNFSSISPLCLVNISHTLETHPSHETQGPPFEKRCQDYLLGYMCFRCDKVKQSNYKALPAGSSGELRGCSWSASGDLEHI